MRAESCVAFSVVAAACSLFENRSAKTISHCTSLGPRLRQYTSQRGVRSVPVPFGAARLPAAFLRTARSNSVTLDVVLSWVLGNNPAKCGVDRKSSCREKQITDAHIYMHKPHQ